MNPAILGALIGAVPGTLAAALAVWSASRSISANLEQTKLTLAADHKRWLRERRSDVYVDVLRFLREAERRRHFILVPHKLSSETRLEIAGGFDIYKTPETQELVARTIAFVSDRANDSFNEAWWADQRVWILAEEEIKGDDFTINAELKKAMDVADNAFREFIKVARYDLQEDHIIGAIEGSVSTGS